MQSALQSFIDNSISKTINVPQDCPFVEFQQIYDLAYDRGLKGCTTFRPNPITGSVLSEEAAGAKALIAACLSASRIERFYLNTQPEPELGRCSHHRRSKRRPDITDRFEPVECDDASFPPRKHSRRSTQARIIAATSFGGEGGGDQRRGRFRRSAWFDRARLCASPSATRPLHIRCRGDGGTRQRWLGHSHPADAPGSVGRGLEFERFGDRCSCRL